MKKGAPLAPAVNAVTDKDMVVTGTTAPNSIISVKSGLTFIGKGKANSQGVFSIAISVQKAGTKISVMVRDSAGNSSFQLRYQYKKLRLLRYFVVK
ncbi:Ig-like domain-containing protein [Bacillus pseudomycoides]|uniref:Ig-like domain-containing protein n=1 Tax=Bacillus pseudomycoides TaxID=64104 RepID=UPI00211D5A35|nr:Ig-like domain-containing protein [Bacillus pseudomycoides]